MTDKKTLADIANTRDHLVRCDGRPDISFRGQLLGYVDSAKDRHTGELRDRWTELALYRTEAGSYVAEQVGASRLGRELTRRSAAVCATLAEVQAFLGHGTLAKELYDQCGIDASVRIK